MVLSELGSELTKALRRLNTTTVIDDDVIDECLKQVGNALLQSDVNVKIVMQVRKSIKAKMQLDTAMCSGTNRRKFVQKCVLEELTNMLTAEKSTYKLKKGKCNVVMFVGLQGSGKTTTCTKYAHLYNRKGWKTALVCADTFRAGAFDQLKQNATKARIPFYGSYSESDPVKIAEDGVATFRKEKYELIIVDTSGRHKQESALFEEMQQVHTAVAPDEVIFVMDSHIGQACFDQAQAFSEAVSIGSVVVTKLDGHAKGGGALSAVSACNAPISFIGTGEHIDEIEAFDARGFVSRLLGLGDLTSLVETLSDIIPKEKNAEMMERLSSGQFTMRDMYEQLQTVTKMGPISKVMSMVPGVNTEMLPQGYEQNSVNRIKRFMTIMDSMTGDELDCKRGIKHEDVSRVMRLSKGSGSHPMMVVELLQEHKRFESMFGKMGKAGLMKEGNEKQLMRNPQEVARKLQSCMDPTMLNYMGGAKNMVNVMQQLEKTEGADFLTGKVKKKKKASK